MANTQIPQLISPYDFSSAYEYFSTYMGDFRGGVIAEHKYYTPEEDLYYKKLVIEAYENGQLYPTTETVTGISEQALHTLNFWINAGLHPLQTLSHFKECV